MSDAIVVLNNGVEHQVRAVRNLRAVRAYPAGVCSTKIKTIRGLS
jgi:hypothetical protein